MCQHLFAYFSTIPLKPMLFYSSKTEKPQEPVISLIPVEQNILILQRIHHQLFVLGR